MKKLQILNFGSNICSFLKIVLIRVRTLIDKFAGVRKNRTPTNGFEANYLFFNDLRL